MLVKSVDLNVIKYANVQKSIIHLTQIQYISCQHNKDTLWIAPLVEGGSTGLQ